MRVFIILIVLVCSSQLQSKDLGGKTWINPVSDVCWSCMFPIHLGGINLTKSHKDTNSYKKLTCSCEGGVVGLPLAFWEPGRIVEVTRVPYKMVSLGGSKLSSASIKQRGTVTTSNGRGRKSFYHVHYYQFPILKLLELGGKFICIEDFDFDIAYMSELDPFWKDDEWSAILHPETLVFSNPISQSACIADCIKSSLHSPFDKLFWCAGCQGSYYPFNGHVAHHIGGIQASSLLVHRVLGKLHATGILKGFEKEDFCRKKTMRILRKSLYKTQLIYPVAQTKGPCNTLGKSDILWGAGKTFPIKGEEFVYLVWTKRHCCLDPVTIARKVSSGGTS
ncbi:MAG: TraU family protein [Rhabdochlamydiaceae bacterium]|nr:TraU family protein [Candidatus Amphrikana amoebophyrae]